MDTLPPTTDVLIIGSGIAGLYAALHAAKTRNVTIVTKDIIAESNSAYAQGGIAAVLDPLDSIEDHINDTLIAGSKLNNIEAVRVLVEEAPEHIHALIELGVPFDTDDDHVALTQEGGHSARRIAHVKDATGRAIETALITHVREHERITVCEHHTAVDLLLENDRVIGAQVLLPDGTPQTITATATILATGGAGQVFAHSTNPEVATGDGIAMALRAGATVDNLEFVQFHPTTLNLPDTPHFLLSEALRGEGAVLRNAQGVRFMPNFDPRAELAPRDVVSLAVYTEMQHGEVTLDITEKNADWIRERFPTISGQLEEYGFDLATDQIPISPAAHYMCGGITTDLNGQTSLAGLYAIGETANTGVHGANRLASNSLLECVVFGARAGQHAATQEPHNISAPTITPTKTASPLSEEAYAKLKRDIQFTLWSGAGVVRTTQGIKEALLTVHNFEPLISSLPLNTRQHVELRNIYLVGCTIIEQALNRPISIGSHFISE